MASNLPVRRSTLRQKGWSPTYEAQDVSLDAPRTPLNLQKPLPPRPISYTSSIYSDDVASCKSTVDDINVDLMSRQNPNRYGMDVSRILPPVHPEYCCDIDEEEDEEEEDSGESSSPVTPVGPPERSPELCAPIYSMFTSSGSDAYNFSSWPSRRSNDFHEGTAEIPKGKENSRPKTFTLMTQGRQGASNKMSNVSCFENTPKGLGINQTSGEQPAITFAGPPASNTFGNRTTARRAPAPPPLKLYERALADSYVKTPYPSSARHLSVMSQKSVFEDNDDDDDDEYNPYIGRRRKESLYLKRFSGLGDFTQTLRRSSIRMSMGSDVKEIIPTIDTTRYRPAPSIPQVAAMSARRATTICESGSPSSQPRRTTSAPASSRVKTILLKAKRSLSLVGFADDSKKERKESKDREALRKLVKSGTTDAKLGQNAV